MAQTKRKTRESFGAIRQLPSGRFQASYVGEDGKRYTAPHTYDTKTDARGWLSIQRSKIVTGKWSPMDAATAAGAKSNRTDTLGEFAGNWIETRMNRHGEPLRDRTRVEYERLLKGPLAPLTDSRVVAPTPEVVKSWHDDQIRTGKRTQASRAYGLLNALMATAVEQGRIVANPCRVRGAQNSNTGKTVEPPTAAELQTILDTITPRYRAAVILAAWTGCRWGEMTELRRKDVTVRDGDGFVSVIVQISRAVTKVPGKGFVIGKTKSAAGVRSIVVPPHVQSVVIDHLSTNVDDSPDALLFPASDGVTHLAQSTFGKHWEPARKAAGREDMPWHALRHHGATKAAQAGATLRELQERLGHSTVAAAMRYQHTAGRDAEIAQRMSDLANTNITG